MKPDSYLIVAPDKPTDKEMARGATLIPSMLDEGAFVWRVPAELPKGVRFEIAAAGRTALEENE